jgi:putative DNA primase/helicase
MYNLPTASRYILGVVENNSKYPLNSETLARHSAHDPAIWRSQADIDAVLDELGSEYILGFVISAQDNYFFIDLDGCLDDTGAWSALAVEACQTFAGCYIEVSVSGRGLHIIGRYAGDIGTHACKNTQLHAELYTSGRFCALSRTHAAGDAETVRTSELIEFIEKYFKPKVAESGAGDEWTTEPCGDFSVPQDNELVLSIILGMPARSDVFRDKEHASFKDLFTANAEELTKFYPAAGQSGGYDASAADSALAYRLHYFLGGNCERVREIMQMSALKREKWDRPDYLLRTITSARNKQAKHYSYHRAPDPSRSSSVNSSTGGAVCQVNKRILEKTHYPLLNSTFTKPLDVVENLKFLLDKLGVIVRWDDMKRYRDIKIPGVKLFKEDEENDALRAIKDLCILNSFPITRIEDHLERIAQSNHFHPVIEMIKNNPWDGIERFRSFADTLITTEPELAHSLLKKWMCQAIAAAFSPEGFASQGVIVLCGPQNIGKTRWIKALDPFNQHWVKEGAVLDPANKDSVFMCLMHWIVELGELDGTFKRADIARLKSFITSDFDLIRRPYARCESKFTRRTVFIASVNDDNFLVDKTGNRRFWTIPVTEINNNHGLSMVQIWAEIYHDWENGGQTWLSQDDAQKLTALNETHEQIDPFHELFEKFYDVSTGWEKRATVMLTATEILHSVGYSQVTMPEATRMAHVVRKSTGKKSYRRKYLVPHFKPS